MSMTDPIADFLTRIRNGLQARKPSVAMPSSRLKCSLAEVFKKEGYIADYREEAIGKLSNLVIDLKYDENNQPAIEGLKRMSKPGQRVYVGKEDLPKVRSGLGVAIVTTSRGVMTDSQARKMNIGGEVICTVW
ncbi:30S ribosomal protein S8 [Myxococcota bacterium]|nr:30S ribosomal protein S8 [Myxococcota bacterium]MBU1411283.1 30S ribosomal protein S8 [Myxococcota bacterium]MBU1509658.1 30S ribosomal protein S8 [Myxococcota bacterium]PKN25809.1 MAG: 30S ribosomal protein S8 [Deltaproteobacteria bacterium HGW-Deltaproteobacteria-22]